MNRFGFRTRFVVLVSSLLLIAACGDDGGVPSTTIASTTSSTTSTPTSTSSPTTTTTAGDVAPSAAEAEAAITAYFEASASGDHALAQEHSAAWVHEWERFNEIEAFLLDRPPAPPFEFEISVLAVEANANGTIYVDGDIALTIELGEEDQALSFSTVALIRDDSGALVVVDFLSETPDGRGPIQGALSDQIGYDPVSMEADGVTVTTGPAFRTAGWGVSAVMFTVYITNETESTLTALTGPFDSEFRLGSETEVPPMEAVQIPDIPPGDGGWGLLRFNQPDGMVEGEYTAAGTLAFTLVDEAGTRHVLEVTTPEFPADL